MIGRGAVRNEDEITIPKRVDSEHAIPQANDNLQDNQPICSQTAVTPPWLPGASPFAHNACGCAHLPSPHLPVGPYCLCPIPMDPSFLILGGCYLKHDRVHFLPSTPGREAIYHFVCSVPSFCSAYFPSLLFAASLSLLATLLSPLRLYQPTVR
jgi:hypothetical protein